MVWWRGMGWIMVTMDMVVLLQHSVRSVLMDTFKNTKHAYFMAELAAWSLNLMSCLWTAHRQLFWCGLFHLNKKTFAWLICNRTSTQVTVALYDQSRYRSRSCPQSLLLSETLHIANDLPTAGKRSSPFSPRRSPVWGVQVKRSSQMDRSEWCLERAYFG